MLLTLMGICAGGATAEEKQTQIDPIIPSIESRGEREKLASSAMATENELKQRATDWDAFNETKKRLSEVEASDPARALREYRRFIVDRPISPALGVQVALKISQVRQSMGDSKSALLTCDVLRKKYASEPSVALLSLQKVRIMMAEQNLQTASECLKSAFPGLLSLGPQYYAEVSDILLQLGQLNIDSGQKDSQQRAQSLLIDLEEVYFRWIKKNTVDHLWQRFEDLEGKYQQVGAEQRAQQLLFKVGDAVLQMPPDPANIEGAVLSLEMAQWLSEQGKDEQAAVFYARIPEFKDDWHTALASYDKALPLIQRGQTEDARKLLLSSLEVGGERAEQIKVVTLGTLASSYYANGDKEQAKKFAQESIKQFSSLRTQPGDVGIVQHVNAAKDLLARMERWDNMPIVCPDTVCSYAALSTKEPTVVRFPVRTRDAKQEVVITSSNPRIKSFISALGQDGDAVDYHYYERQVVLIVPAEEVNAHFETVITVTSPQHPTFKNNINLRIESRSAN